MLQGAGLAAIAASVADDKIEVGANGENQISLTQAHAIAEQAAASSDRSATEAERARTLACLTNPACLGNIGATATLLANTEMTADAIAASVPSMGAPAGQIPTSASAPKPPTSLSVPLEKTPPVDVPSDPPTDLTEDQQVLAMQNELAAEHGFKIVEGGIPGNYGTISQFATATRQGG